MSLSCKPSDHCAFMYRMRRRWKESVDHVSALLDNCLHLVDGEHIIFEEEEKEIDGPKYPLRAHVGKNGGEGSR